jgi:hypothetical protein
MKMTWTFIGLCILGISIAFIYILLSNLKVDPEELTERQGRLDRPPLPVKDEYESRIVGLRIYLKGEEQALRIPGKLLNLADPRIFDLEQGTRISFLEKREKKGNRVRLIFGLEDSQGIILEKSQALDYYRKKFPLVLVLGIILLNMAIGVFLTKTSG